MQIKSFVKVAASALTIAAAISIGNPVNGASGRGGGGGAGHAGGAGRAGGSGARGGPGFSGRPSPGGGIARPGGSSYPGAYRPSYSGPGSGSYRGAGRTYYNNYSRRPSYSYGYGGVYLGLGGFYDPWYYGNGYGYGWGDPWGYYDNYNQYTDPSYYRWYQAQQQAQAFANEAAALALNDPSVPDMSQPDVSQSPAMPSSSYLADARAAFRKGDYQNAARLAAHASVDSPQDAQVHELASLALFASGNYHAASGAAHAALSMAPPADWAHLYGYYRNANLYTKQLRALEKFTTEHPDSAAERFLLGYHYLMIGEQEKAKREFAAVVKLTPNDTVAKHYAEQAVEVEVEE